MALDCNTLGAALRKMDRCADAESFFRRALQIDVNQLGPEHIVVAVDLDTLAALAQERGAYDEAEEMYAKALAVGDLTLAATHADTVRQWTTAWDGSIRAFDIDVPNALREQTIPDEHVLR